MAERSVEHASFTIERRYHAPPARVFAAWATSEAKARWFGGPEEWQSEPHELDFRVGGHELDVGGPAGGPVHTYRAVYWDIVPEERIVYTYDMHLEDERISVSLATVELKPDGKSTRLIYTEQGAFLDRLDTPEQREQGTGSLLDALGKELQKEQVR
jgi:uncharacterized protein YndB with AHSA1/START domain